MNVALKNMNLEQISKTMSDFDTMFENLDVASNYVGQSLE